MFESALFDYTFLSVQSATHTRVAIPQPGANQAVFRRDARYVAAEMTINPRQRYFAINGVAFVLIVCSRGDVNLLTEYAHLCISIEFFGKYTCSSAVGVFHTPPSGSNHDIAKTIHMNQTSILYQGDWDSPLFEAR